MIIQCKSCDKKFIVPDSAIGAAGRLVQCSSCGNKWNQFLQKPLFQQETMAVKKIQKKLPKKKIVKNKRTGPTLYTEEYLQKKHGININEKKINKIKSKNISENKKIIKFSFYNYISIIVIFIIFLFGILNLTKNQIISNYPFMEIYILYLYETLSNIQIIINDFITDY